MMKQQRSPQWNLALYAIFLPLFAALVLAFGCQQDDVKEEISQMQTSATEDVDAIVKIAEEMPRFPGCEDLQATREEIEKCALKKMLDYLNENLEYPEEAKSAGTEGIVVIQFIVEKSGQISDEKIVRNVSGGCGQAALRVVNQMNEDGLAWRPGYQDGKSVRVEYNLPVKFKLADDENVDTGPDIESTTTPDPPKAPERVLKGEGDVFKVVEEKPRFPGCEDNQASREEIEACAQQKMMEYLYENVEYPEEAKSTGIEGQVVVQFIVEKSGEISNVKIVRDISGGCSEEALRVVNKMNEDGLTWRPGYQNGNPVNVQYHLPVKFKLD